MADDIVDRHNPTIHQLCVFILFHHPAVCAGVLFALKILNNHYHPGGVTYVLGLAVDNRYASWVELVLIHLTYPG